MTKADNKAKNKKLELSQPKKLELKKTVETGQVRQNFSHGRSKMVMVEVKKKRSFERDSVWRMTEINRNLEFAKGQKEEKENASEVESVDTSNESISKLIYKEYIQ